MSARILIILAAAAMSCGGNNNPGVQNNGTSSSNNASTTLNNVANNTANTTANNTTPTATNNGTNNAVPDSARNVVDAFARGAGLAAAFGGGVSGDGDGLVRDRRDGMTTDDGARQRFEAGFSGNSVVEPAGCAAFTWANLVVTVVMTDCTFEATGVPVSGTVTAGVSFAPVTFDMTFADLTVDTATYDGNVVSIFGDNGSTSASVTFTSTEGTKTLALSAVSVAAQEAGVVVNGEGTVTDAMGTTSFTAADVTWAPMNCLPSSGTLTYSDGGQPVVIGFLPATPTTGEVSVKVGPLPATTVALLPPCPA